MALTVRSEWGASLRGRTPQSGLGIRTPQASRSTVIGHLVVLVGTLASVPLAGAALWLILAAVLGDPWGGGGLPTPMPVAPAPGLDL